MVRILFDPYDIHLTDILITPQQGSGPYFVGFRQRGYGLGDIFRHAWRFLRPIVQTLGKEGLNAGARILNDVHQGANLKTAVKKQGAQSAQRLLQSASDKVGLYGSGKRKRHLKKTEVVGRLVHRKAPLKNKRQDIFGIY